MGRKILGLILMLSISPIAQAETRFLQAKTASEVREHLRKTEQSTIVFIDIDDTIITPVAKIFRRAPYNKLIDDIKQHKEQYPNYEEIISNWRLQRKIMLIDNDWPQLLSQLKQHTAVYGLTKMDIGKIGNIPSMEEWRNLELTALDITFSNNPAIPEGKANNGASFSNGLFMTGSNSKSQTIAQYWPYLKADGIVMIDDRLEHLQDIAQFCAQNSIDFTGILFNGLEALPEIPDPAVAHLQKHHLIEHAQWLEDAEAEALLKAKGR